MLGRPQSTLCVSAIPLHRLAGGQVLVVSESEKGHFHPVGLHLCRLRGLSAVGGQPEPPILLIPHWGQAIQLRLST